MTADVANELEAALQQFEAAEANLAKLETIWRDIEALASRGSAFATSREYEELRLAFRRILESLPAIDGWRVEDHLVTAEVRHLDAGAFAPPVIETRVHGARTLPKQGRQLREYRFKLDRKRTELIRETVLQLMDRVDEGLRELLPRFQGNAVNHPVSGDLWDGTKAAVKQIDTLLGSSISRPSGWTDLQRHLYFGMVQDLLDIQKHDWPSVKKGLESALYGKYDPVPVTAPDLGALAAARPTGTVPTRLKWESLSAEDFERLIFLLISETPGYENAEWLQKTNAADKGRDLSVVRVYVDPLTGTRRERVIIQCKHWLSRSVAVDEVVTVRGQMELWQPPRVDVLIVASSGRFTTDAVALVEQHNQADKALKIEMWPESHLEKLLASRPHLIGEFRLR